MLLDIDGPGQINHLWFTVSNFPNQPTVFHDLVLRIDWILLVTDGTNLNDPVIRPTGDAQLIQQIVGGPGDFDFLSRRT